MTRQSRWWVIVVAVGLIGGGAGCSDEEEPTPAPIQPCPTPGEADEDEPDSDGDGWIDRCDVCVSVIDPEQADADHDGVGDLCEEDDDNDGVVDANDNCPLTLHNAQSDLDNDGAGDVCDRCPLNEDQRDGDGDGINDCDDLCSSVASADNGDGDGDGIGDACDLCPSAPDAGQSDLDGDGVGDACDAEDGFTLEEASVASVHAALRSGEVTCEALVEGYLERIQRYDLDVHDGPPINAFVAFNARALEQARALDDALAQSGALVGPLHCIPIVIKDLYASEDLPVSSGTLAFVGMQPRSDGFAVGRLKERGAIVLATTSMDEMSRGIFGIGGRHGKTGNAYDPRRNPGGSSSGSGAAVGANFALASTGTDNCASLTIPGAYNGLVSLRGSVGLVSMGGVFPSGRMDAVPGPLARSVPDLALILDAMAGTDPDDPRTLTYEGERPASYTSFLKAEGLEGKRLGVLRRLGRDDAGNVEYTFSGADPHTLRVFNGALAHLERLGATVIDNIDLPTLDTRRSGYGFGQDFDVFVANTTGPITSFEDACRTERFSFHVYSGDVQQCLDAIAWDRTNARVGSDGHKAAIARYEANRQLIERVMDDLELDALVYPVDGQGAAGVFSSRANCTASSVSQTPELVVPIGYSADGLPIALMIHGRKWDEGGLIELAYAWEHATHHRRPPRLTSILPADVAAPPFDPVEATDVRLKIGEASFDEVLGAGGKFELSVERFQPIVEQVLEDEGWDWLLDPP